MKYFLYILLSEVRETYYAGVSQDPNRRCFFHNHASKGYTRRFRPWSLVYILGFETKEEALLAEQKVKTWKSKKMIRELQQHYDYVLIDTAPYGIITDAGNQNKVNANVLGTVLTIFDYRKSSDYYKRAFEAYEKYNEGT